MMTFLDDTILEVKHLKLLGIAEVAGGLTVAVSLFSEIVPSDSHHCLHMFWHDDGRSDLVHME